MGIGDFQKDIAEDRNLMIQCTKACHVLLVWANGIITPDINSLLETWT